MIWSSTRRFDLRQRGLPAADDVGNGDAGLVDARAGCARRDTGTGGGGGGGGLHRRLIERAAHQAVVVGHHRCDRLGVGADLRAGAAAGIFSNLPKYIAQDHWK